MSKISARGLVLRNTLSAFRPSALATAAAFSTRSAVYKFQPLTKAQTSKLITGKQWLRFYSSNLPDHIKVTLPALSPTMEMGSIVAWAKKEGEQVAEGDLLCEIETDKATMGFETPEEGYLAKILLQEGSRDVPIGKLLCIIVENESDVTAFKDYQPGEGDAAPSAKNLDSKPAAAPAQQSAPPKVEPPREADKLTTPPPLTPPQSPTDRLKITPYAKKLATEQGINVDQLRGSGPGGRIIASDLLGGAAGQKSAGAHATATPPPSSEATRPQQPKQQQQQSAPSAGAHTPHFEDVQLSNMRKTIAKRLTESKSTIPHYYLTSEIVVDDLLKIREKLNDIVAKQEKGDAKPHKLSINDFIIKASALACLRVPEANSFFMDTFIRKNQTVDVSVAVSTEVGLLTPIVFDADSKGLLTISKEVNELAKRAREGKLQPQEFQGGTFTVSNLGMFGSVDHFTAIINPPQSCILAIGGAKKRLIPSEDGHRQVTTIKVTLSCDHRVVDGAVGAVWLRHFKEFLEKPTTMLL
ncbi:Acetyltransferase component of pyruvate dehydrogenase complex [Aphelenchoides fujianensis]|nr:Acetyltransferase component of pyruvate dehydrogenase complex [Aphelenchoides fujianensis]